MGGSVLRCDRCPCGGDTPPQPSDPCANCPDCTPYEYLATIANVVPCDQCVHRDGIWYKYSADPNGTYTLRQCGANSCGWFYRGLWVWTWSAYSESGCNDLIDTGTMRPVVTAYRYPGDEMGLNVIGELSPEDFAAGIPEPTYFNGSGFFAACDQSMSFDSRINGEGIYRCGFDLSYLAVCNEGNDVEKIVDGTVGDCTLVSTGCPDGIARIHNEPAMAQCIHWGGPTGETIDTGHGCAGIVPIHSCDLKGKCTIYSEVEGFPCCSTCPLKA